jgi:hypothetical protein
MAANNPIFPPSGWQPNTGLTYNPTFTTTNTNTSFMQQATTPVPPPTMKMIYPFEFKISDFILRQEDEVRFYENGDVEIKKANGPTFLLYSEDERLRLTTLQSKILEQLSEQQKLFNEKLQIEQFKYASLQKMYIDNSNWRTSHTTTPYIIGTGMSDLNDLCDWKITTIVPPYVNETNDKKFQLKSLWNSMLSNTTKTEKKK